MTANKLPDFKQPPITEVAISIQFEALPGLRAIHLGAIWDAFGRENFPQTEEQPTLPAQNERAGTSRGLLPPQISILNVAPMPRYFFINKNGSEAIQIQQDRFGYNWRKSHENDVYPRFGPIEERFEEYARRFVSFVQEQQLGSIRITQAEVTYVNQIRTEGVPGKLEKVVSVFSGDYTTSFLHDPEEVHLALRYPILRDGDFCGRLYVDVRPITSLEGQAALNMVLLARGKPDGNDIKAARRFFEIAHEHIVSGFTSITSKQMHQIWGRIDNG